MIINTNFKLEGKDFQNKPITEWIICNIHNMLHPVKPLFATVLRIKKLITQLNSNEEYNVLVTNNKYRAISTEAL